MSVLNNGLIFGGDDVAPTYTIAKSLRFRSSASAYLSRTPASAGNQQKFTYSCWFKLGTASTFVLFNQRTGTSLPLGSLQIYSSNRIEFTTYVAGPSQQCYLLSTQNLRDYAAWYHLVLSIDTTQATSANRIKMYLNGSQITAFDSATYPSQNTNLGMNTTDSFRLGADTANSAYYDGYQTEVNFIDGQQLTPSSFGSTDPITGSWIPARYTGTYGTNGFYLPFTDVATTSGSNAGLGKDFSGNANYWNTNNISVTAGTTYDSMTDVPTLTSATTANYAVWNPLTQSNANYTFTNGNLNATNPSTSGANFAVVATMAMPSTGQFYWELTATAIGGNSGNSVGIVPIANYSGYNSIQGLVGYSYGSTGNKLSNGSSVSYGASWTTNDVIGIAYDAGAGSLTFYKNGTTQGVAFTGLSGQYVPAMDAFSAGGMAINFGQRPFLYTPPSGYVALNTFNM